jgi:hypothetical protein
MGWSPVTRIWLLVGLSALVLLFLVLLFVTAFIDTNSMVLPGRLSYVFHVTGVALEVYAAQHGRFPDKLEDLEGLVLDLDGAVDPYSPRRSLLGYRRVVSATGEYYELSTVRLAGPAKIGFVTGGYEWTPEFEKLLETRLAAEARGDAVRPGGPFGGVCLRLVQSSPWVIVPIA